MKILGNPEKKDAVILTKEKLALIFQIPEGANDEKDVKNTFNNIMKVKYFKFSLLWRKQTHG